MNILFDIGHPAHVHLFKNFIAYLKRTEHTVVVVTRNKDITNRLLEHYGIEFFCLSSPGKNFSGMFIELIRRDIQIWKLHQKHQFDVAFGTSVSNAHLATISRIRSYTFNEDDDQVVPLFTYLTYPFTTTILNPDCIRYTKWASKRIFYPSYHELAYLHPGNFTPDLRIIERYGLEPQKYIIFRCSALKAHHDVGAKGISPELREKISQLLSSYPVVTSQEGDSTMQIAPWDMHHVLAFAKMIISDSQTMTIEGAVLGIPSVRINTFVGKSTVIDELEQRYYLAIGILPEQEQKILSTIEQIVTDDQTTQRWQNRRKRMLNEKIDLNQWMQGYFEHEIRKKQGSSVL